MTSPQWFGGVVKEVQSGDTVVVVGSSMTPNSIPPEKRLILASLSAPRLPRKDGSLSEEFAWESREYLRKLAIGRRCMFRVDYKIDSIDREFGTVVVDKENNNRLDLGLTVVKAGWAKVRGSSDPKTQATDIDALRAAFTEADAAGLGLHTPDPVSRSASCFAYDTDSAAIAADFISQRGKGVPVAAIVDAVLTGSTLKVTLLPERAVVTFAVAGALCPNVRRSADGTLEGEPFGVEAKSFTELKVLNREVRIVMLGGDNGARVYGELVYPEDGKAASLAATLLGNGCAKFVDWSARLLPVDKPMIATGAALKKREITAQEQTLGIWKLQSPVPRDTVKTSSAFSGTVLEVVSGDTLIVKMNDGQESKISLASVRAPRMRPQGAAEPEPYAREAKDFLRKHAVGVNVSVALEYTRKVTTATLDAPSLEPLVMQMGNIELPSSRGPQQLAEMIVRRGFAAVQGGREGEERSTIFGALMTAEEYAKGKRLGLHSGKQPGTLRVNDCSLPGSAARARQYLPFFQRHGTIPCVVEHIMSGSRVKLYVPKESVTIVFSPSGVKTPSRGGPARGNLPAMKAEPFGDDAYQFVRERFLQRDAVVAVESCDKAGTMLGRLTIGSMDMSIALLSSGLGSLHPSFSPDRVAGATALITAQESAQADRKGQWHDYDPAEAAGEATEGEEAAANGTTRRVVVTHVQSASCIHLQPLDEPRVSWVAGECAAAAAMPFEGFGAQPPRAGGKVLAQFSLDNLWYRAYVEAILNQATKNEAARVYFIDFGNTEIVPLSKLRKMDAALAAVAPLASTAQLAYVRVPDGSDPENVEPAVVELTNLVDRGVPFKMQVVLSHRSTAGTTHPRDTGGIQHVLLYPDGGDDDIAESVNARMLKAGMARLPAGKSMRSAAAREAAAMLSDSQNEARREHRGIFRYGDPGDSEDEEDMRR